VLYLSARPSYVVVLASALAFSAGLTTGCSATPAGGPTPIGGNEHDAALPDVTRPDATRPDVSQATFDARADGSSPADTTGLVDAPEVRPDRDPPSDAPAVNADAVSDGPRRWPPPGTAYLTRLDTSAQYDQLAAQLAGTSGSVLFLIRRRANDAKYPYPWDEYECIFETDVMSTQGGHLPFLYAMDKDRATNLYFVDSKTQDGNLIPGRFIRTGGTNELKVLFENIVGLSGASTFSLDSVARFLRDRISRCVRFTTSFRFVQFCGSASTECPLP
jgi:hypothetical protein